MLKPVLAITLFRRPNYTRQLFDALAQCEGIEEIPIVIHCDEVDKGHEFRADCVKTQLAAFDFVSSLHKKDEIWVSNPKRGIDLSKLFIVPKAFERGNFVIFLEDDHIPSKDALQWFIQMGERFERDERIGFITGYAKQTEEEFRASSPSDIGYSGINDGQPGFNPSSWATWKDRWDYFLPNDGEEYRRICGDQGLFDHFLHLRHGEKLYKHTNPETIGIDKPKWPGLVGPKIARTQLVGWENAEHTPSKEYFLENEFNEWGMWNL